MSGREWFSDEQFWRDLAPFMFNELRLAEPEEQLDALLRLADPPGHDVLDLCCGPGRWALALAARGRRVTGVDRSPYLLARARAAAADAGLELELVESDMRDFRRPAAFDLALCLFTSFGYFADRDEDLAVLRLLHENLRPGGVGVVDVVGKECLARIFQPTSAEELPDGTVLVQRHAIEDDWTRLRNHWSILGADGSVRSYEFALNIYSGQELRDRLHQAGFVAVSLHGDWAGSPYGLEAARLIAVARKGGSR